MIIDSNRPWSGFGPSVYYSISPEIQTAVVIFIEWLDDYWLRMNNHPRTSDHEPSEGVFFSRVRLTETWPTYPSESVPVSPRPPACLGVSVATGFSLRTERQQVLTSASRVYWAMCRCLQGWFHKQGFRGFKGEKGEPGLPGLDGLDAPCPVVCFLSSFPNPALWLP